MATNQPLPPEPRSFGSINPGKLVIRPSWGAVRWWGKRRHLADYRLQLLIALLFQFLAVYGGTRDYAMVPLELGGMLIAVSIGIALFGVAMCVYLSGTFIYLTDEVVGMKRVFHRTVEIPRRQIARIVLCSVVEGLLPNQPPQPILLALAPSGRCILSLYAFHWYWPDLETIWDRIGVPVEGTWDDIVVQEDLGARFPGSF